MNDALRPLAALLVESVEDRAGPLPAGSEGVGVDDLLAAGDLHRVTPAIRRRVLAAPEAPAEWRPVLDAARVDQLFRHMRAASDLALISSTFGDETRWAVAKGPVLADLIWPHPDMRVYGDLDVYVHPLDFAAALEALEARGFVLVDRNWAAVRRSGRSELALQGPSGLMLDLHWDLVGAQDRLHRRRLDLAGMLDRRVPATLGSGVEVPVFAPEDLFLHVAVHAAQSGANRLMWLGDLHHAARTLTLDWDEVGRRAAQWDVTALAAVTLARVERVFGDGFPLPDRMRRSASKTAWARWAAARDRRHPFPGLPGDASLGGGLYMGARATGVGSALFAMTDAVRVRGIEARVRRRGPDANPRHEDRADVAARDAYLQEVGAHASRG